MKALRAKFQVTTITHYENGSEVKMLPVTRGSPENEEFFKWTPSGEIKIGLIKKEQAEVFQPGREFYIDMTPVE